jgi:hypothetical protein
MGTEEAVDNQEGFNPAKEEKKPTDVRGTWSLTATNWLFSSLIISPTQTFIHCSCWRL